MRASIGKEYRRCSLAVLIHFERQWSAFLPEDHHGAISSSKRPLPIAVRLGSGFGGKCILGRT